MILDNVKNIMDQIDYGWIDINNEKHINNVDNIQELYRVSSPDEVIKNKIGICFDQVELERYLLEDDYSVGSYAIIAGNRMVHTFIILNNDEEYIYYEHSSFKNKGEYHYGSLKTALDAAVDAFMKTHKIKNRKLLKLIRYEKLEPLTTFGEIKDIFLNQSENLLDKDEPGRNIV